MSKGSQRRGGNDAEAIRNYEESWERIFNPKPIAKPHAAKRKTGAKKPSRHYRKR